MKNSLNEADDGKDIIGCLSERFAEMATQIDSITELIEHIATAASETATSTEESALSFQERAAVMQEIDYTANNFSSSAHVLMQEIDIFNL